jgi:diguanylate cyclase (GGDEF)-like protein
VPEYALILEENPTRAAQYSRLVELAELVPTSARSAEEAVFHVSRLGTPRLVIIELALPGEAQMQFLRDLRHLANGGHGAPVVAIVDSRAMYEQAARQMIELNIVALLTRSHNLSAVDRAIRVTLSKPLIAPGAWNDVTRPPSQPIGLGRNGRDAAARDKDNEDPLVVAERLAENPLVERLAHLRVLDKGTSIADLQRLIADTATVFQVPMSMIWLERSGRTAFATHPRLDNDAALREGGGAWAAFRDALGDVPLHVADTSQHRLLQRNPLVRDGVVRCYAGAPLRDGEGNIAGAICLAHSRTGAIAPELLDPLVFWTLRIGTELMPVHPHGTSPQEASADRPGTGPTQVGGGRGFVAAMQTGVILSDSHGSVTYANPQAGSLLRLKGRLRGLRRGDLIGLVGISTDAPDASLKEIDAALINSQTQCFDLGFRSPVRRTLRWRTTPLKLGDSTGRLDEIIDVTPESAAAEAREKLVRVDSLTGLPNRRGGEDAIGREISRCLRSGGPLSVALFEIESLDVFEPKVADRVVRAMAWLLRDALRGYDLAVRYSRRHLLAVLPGVTASQMVGFAERYRGAVERTSIEGLPRVTISGGIAEFEPAKDADRLLADAAAALSEARKQGGNRVV